LFLFQEQYSVF